MHMNDILTEVHHVHFAPPPPPPQARAPLPLRVAPPAQRAAARQHHGHRHQQHQTRNHLRLPRHPRPRHVLNKHSTVLGCFFCASRASLASRAGLAGLAIVHKDARRVFRQVRHPRPPPFFYTPPVASRAGLRQLSPAAPASLDLRQLLQRVQLRLQPEHAPVPWRCAPAQRFVLLQVTYASVTCVRE